MIFRYWLEDGHTTAIKNVDRVLFDSLDRLVVRSLDCCEFMLTKLVFGVHYIQFTVTKE